MKRGVLAIDIGASGGKVGLAALEGNRLTFTEISRFDNRPLVIHSRSFWNLTGLFQSIIDGIQKAQTLFDGKMLSVGIDTWGVDFGLLDRYGFLLGSPRHYRDMFMTGVMEEVVESVSKVWIFSRSPTQFQPFNTLYQLIEEQKTRPEMLKVVHTLLTIPSLFNYFLCGEKVIDESMASTTQLYDPSQRAWSAEIRERFNLPDILPPIVSGGTKLSDELVIQDQRLPVAVVIPLSHDTGSAVASIPDLSDDTLFISAGTWCLEGVLTDQALKDPRVMKLNLANEGAYGSKNRLLGNVTGLWLIQELKRKWDAMGLHLSFAEMISEAKQAAPFSGLIHVDDPIFQKPFDMEQAICEDSIRRVGKRPASRGEMIRTALEGIALKAQWLRKELELILNKSLKSVHMVGGGTQNTLLCQLIADATNLPLQAGPIEGTALGNALVQMVTMGMIQDLEEGHRLLKKSERIQTYYPSDHELWLEHQRILDVSLERSEENG